MKSFSKSENVVFHDRKECFPSQKTMFSASENKYSANHRAIDSIVMNWQEKEKKT